MLKKTEKEYKYLVGVEQFQVLLTECNKKYSFVSNKLQANYYYDTEENILNDAKTTVRIRQHDSDMKLQIKKHREVNEGLHISDESCTKIDTLPYKLKISDISDGLFLKGVLITERQIFKLGTKSRICFDKNIYLGFCDYEIELEIDEIDKDIALNVIENFGLMDATKESKSSRFFERLKVLETQSLVLYEK